jgi:arabinan endo-1,5-alpha-L-arabinosidase
VARLGPSEAAILLPLWLLVSLVTDGPAAAQNFTDFRQPYSPDSATLALYHFDQDAGAIATDASYYAYDAANAGAAWTAGGRFGGGLEFDGTDYLMLPSSSEFNTSDATFEAWVYISEVSSDHDMVIIEKSVSQMNGGGRRLGILAGGHAFAWAKATLLGASTAISTTVVPAGSWTHIAAVFEESRRRLAIVVDGVVEDEVTLIVGASEPAPVVVGRKYQENDSYYAGLLDEIRISGVARAIQTPTLPTTWGHIKALWR